LSTYYNEREQPTEVYFLDSAGCQVSRVDLLYDEAGRLVEEAQTHSDEVLPSEMLTLFGGGGKFVQRAHRYNDPADGNPFRSGSARGRRHNDGV
jgi:hypothetical protein